MTSSMPCSDRQKKILQNLLKIIRFRGKIFAAEYDLGKMGIAYEDKDFINLWVSDSSKRSEWNSGNQMRNDGVDIYKSEDNEYYVGKTETGEWLQYTINSKSDKTYTFDIKYFSKNDAKIRVEDALGKQITTVAMKSTGGNENWQTVSAKGINLRKGENKVRIYFENNGVNLKYFEVK